MALRSIGYMIVAAVLAAVAPVHAGKWTEKSLAAKYQQADDAVGTGGAWSDGVAAYVKALGPPNATSEKPTTLGWFIVIGDACHVIQLVADGDFVETTDHETLYSNGDKEKAQCVRLSKLHSSVPKVKPPRAMDVDGAARDVMKLWAEGKFKELYDSTHPKFRENVSSADDIAHLASLFAPIAGPFVKLGSPLEHSFRDSGYAVSGPAIFKNGTLTITLVFRAVDDKLLLRGFDLKLPKNLQQKPDVADAAKVARQALDLILANKSAQFAALADTHLANDLRNAPTWAGDFKAIVHDLGKVASIKLADQHDCNEGQQCLSFELKSAGGASKAELALVFAVSRWEIHSVSLDRPKK